MAISLNPMLLHTVSLGLSRKDLLGCNVSDILKWKNYWITDSVKKALEKGKADEALDTIIYLDKLKVEIWRVWMMVKFSLSM